MHPARPQAPSQPCAACGAPVDPLRAGEVVLLEDGFHYLCNRQCREAFVLDQAAQVVSSTSAARAISDAPPAPAPPPSARAEEPAETAAAEAAKDVGPASFGWLWDKVPRYARWGAAIVAAAALVLAALPLSSDMGPLASVLTLATAALLLVAGYPARRALGPFTWAVGPAGLALAAAGGLAARLADPSVVWPALGAALAALVMTARSAIDAWARGSVDTALRTLTAPLPSTAHVPVDDEAVHPLDAEVRATPADSVRTGQDVLVREGETVAVDGVVQTGEAWVLLHPGARAAVRREPGDPVLAGARLLEGKLRVLAGRVGRERALVRPGRFGAQEASMLGRVTAALAPAGMIWTAAAAVGGGVYLSGEGIGAMLSTAGAVALAAPLVALRRASASPLEAAGAAMGERGIVFHSADALYRAGRIAVVSLCTHGTITERDPEVATLHTVEDDEDEHLLLALAAAVETVAVPHPIARAIVQHAEAHEVTPREVRRASFSPGWGVTALGPDGEPILVGNRQLLLDEGISVAAAEDEAARAEAQGQTAIFVAVGGRVRGVFAVQYPMRSGARAAVQRLFDLDIEVVLLSGDHRGTVEALAQQLDITHVKAELQPADRGREVHQLRETGGAVAAVGYPDHDDAALAAADVPIALAAAGSADAERGIALASDDVQDASAVLWIARRVRVLAWRGLVLSALAGLVLVPAAAAGLLWPFVAALLALAVEAYVLPDAARLLRRIERRVPIRA